MLFLSVFSGGVEEVPVAQLLLRETFPHALPDVEAVPPCYFPIELEARGRSEIIRRDRHHRVVVGRAGHRGRSRGIRDNDKRRVNHLSNASNGATLI